MRVVADHGAIPLQSACADLVVLPHVLEFSSNPHQVLREVSRILMPEDWEGHPLRKDDSPSRIPVQFTNDFAPRRSE